MKVQIRGANHLTPEVEDLGDGTYSATYVPTVAGTDQVAIEINGSEINGSPFDGAVDPGLIEPSNAVLMGEHEGRAGNEHTCSISARDGFNNVLLEGGATIEATVEGANTGSPIDVVDNEDGTYTCTYVPSHCGEDQLTFVADGEPINIQPFLVNVTSGRPVAKDTVVRVRDGAAGEITTIVVETRDEFGNSALVGGHLVDVMIMGANEEATAKVVDKGDGNYEATYTPRTTGTDYVTVTLDGAPIGDSPVASEIGPGLSDPDTTLAALTVPANGLSRASSSPTNTRRRSVPAMVGT